MEFQFLNTGGEGPDEFARTMANMIESGQMNLVEAIQHVMGMSDERNDATNLFHTAMIALDLDHLRPMIGRVIIQSPGNHIGIGMFVHKDFKLMDLHVEVRERLTRCMAAVLTVGGINVRAHGTSLVTDDGEVPFDDIVAGFVEQIDQVDKDPDGWDRWIG